MTAGLIDPLGALCTYLAGVPAVAAIVHGVYRPRLPDEAALPVPMPDSYVVCRRAGGGVLFGGAEIPLGDPRVDVSCYGQSTQDADNLATQVVAALKALNRTVIPGDNTMLLWANIETYPIPLIDPDTDWPYSVVTAQLGHSEVPVA